jgi:poly-gamma-glutamate synthesis protein (capsule biosynthesis protein)
MAVGDIFLKTRNSKSPFEKVQKLFENKDILFGNLETVLSTEGKEKEKAFPSYISPEKVKYLKEVDFDVLNLANNHIMDLGIEGFNETLDVLTKNNLQFIGVSNNKYTLNYIIIEKRGIKLGYLAYAQCGEVFLKESICINKLELKKIIKDIKLIKQKCDFVIVSLHWGIENVFYPSHQQIESAHKLIDAGATIILGHHPHVIQGIERYKHGLIVYSLGNFQFEFNPKECEGKKNKRTNWSVILFLEINEKGLKDYNIIPVKIDKDFVPYIVRGREKEEILNFVFKISEPIIKKQLKENKWFEEISEEYLYGNMKSWIIRIRKYGIKHFLQCIRWLISPFVIKCYIGFLSKKLKGH